MGFSGRLLVLLFIAFATTLCIQYYNTSDNSVRYDGYNLLRIYPQIKEHIRSLLQTFTKDDQVDFWLYPSSPGHPVDIFVGPRRLEDVLRFLNSTGMRIETLMDDVQRFIGGKQRSRDGQDSSLFDWKDYHTIDSINAWLQEQAKNHKEIATLINAGKSTEGRQLLGLRIAHRPNLPVVFVEGGIHAREWITPATATWFIRQALNNSASEIVKSYEWHVFPSVNPDGYAYTQKDRMWRKTRSRSGFFCYGVDANRNLPYQWKGGRFSCSQSYPGSKPASEPEIQGLMAYLKSVADRTRVYISLHSYSQLLMYPWGHTAELPTMAKRFDDIAAKATAKLEARFGTHFEYGPISTTVYKAFGTTTDYAYSINITYPFVFELRDTGKYGFLLPKEQIIPAAEETFDALTVILEEAKK